MPRWTRGALLGLVSLATAILWRVELEWRWGWNSLEWIGPFHWAFPIGATVFLLWMALRLRDAAPNVRHILPALTTLLGAIAYAAGGLTMAWASSPWAPMATGWPVVAYLASPLVTYLVLGAAYFLSVRRLFRPSPTALGSGVASYLLAYPAALLLLHVLHHRGGADAINAIKSGFVFPFITFGLGLPLLGVGRATGIGGQAVSARRRVP